MSDPRESVAEEPGAAEGEWQIWVDTGGTFTDCLALSPDAETFRAKVLSSGRTRAVVAAVPSRNTVVVDTDWDLPDGFFTGCRLLLPGREDRYRRVAGYRSRDRALELAPDGSLDVEPGNAVEIATSVEAPVLAAHWVTRTRLRDPLPATTMRLATTRGTNALLERTGSPTALFITRGFGDLLTIGNQQRPDLFTLNVEKASPLYQAVVEVEERTDGGGQVLQPLDLEALRSESLDLLETGITAVAIALLNSYRNPWHETELARFLGDLGFPHVSCSSSLAPLIKIVPRAETAVVNAYLSQVIGDYLGTVGGAVGAGPLQILTSTGSLVQAEDYLPKDSLLSGPAGGVVGAAAMARQSGWQRSLAFDMGGTSTDVSRFDGEHDYRFETRVGDARLLSPSLAIETVAAGGGSICHFDGRQLKVGPQSAGAEPGPACYGAGGPLTLTDTNLLLGRLRPQSFEIPILPSAAALAAEEILSRVEGAEEGDAGRDSILQGILDIANERMAEAVRRISIRQGYRPSEYALVAFGGAGGQHACALAEILDMDTVLVPEDAGLLSAVGLGRARVERMAERQVLRRLDEVAEDLPEMLEGLAQVASGEMRAAGVPDEDIELGRQLVYLRFEGQEASLGLGYCGAGALATDFARVYEDHYGYRPAEAPVEVETLRVVAASKERSVAPGLAASEKRARVPSQYQEVYLEGGWQRVPVYQRIDLAPGDVFAGPALVFESHCATVVHPGWEGELDGYHCLVLRRLSEVERSAQNDGI